jgi:hypothetical protein
MDYKKIKYYELIGPLLEKGALDCVAVPCEYHMHETGMILGPMKLHPKKEFISRFERCCNC